MAKLYFVILITALVVYAVSKILVKFRCDTDLSYRSSFIIMLFSEFSVLN